MYNRNIKFYAFGVILKLMHTSIHDSLGLWGLTFQAASQVMMYSACLYCVYACVYIHAYCYAYKTSPQV